MLSETGTLIQSYGLSGMFVGFIITVILLLLISAYSSGPRMSPFRYAVIISCLALLFVQGAWLFYDFKVDSMYVLLGVAFMIGINLIIYGFQAIYLWRRDRQK